MLLATTSLDLPTAADVLPGRAHVGAWRIEP
jgi:hypothetical protein